MTMRTPLLSSLLAFGLLLPPAGAQAQFSACLADLKASALERGIRAQTFERTMAGVEADPKVLEAMDIQPEFKTPIWDYLAGLVDQDKIKDGLERLKTYAAPLAAAESKYGVDRHAILAVWGVETDYGNNFGKWPLPQSLSTISCSQSKRRNYFRGELMSLLKIVDRGDLDPQVLKGSWAGAFGHTQFMPTTYLKLAVDGDGDGRRDLVGSIPDALHSTANYLAKGGWVTGDVWGYEVKLPNSYAGPSGRTDRRAVSFWSERGIKKIDGTALTGTKPAGLLLPAGAQGPAFLVFKNYDAIFSYNGADSYALAISILSDHLRGKSGIQTPWPTDDLGLSRAERKELQSLLIARGFEIGAVDGAIGNRTREAIALVQGQAGLEPDGHAGKKILRVLRQGN